MFMEKLGLGHGDANTLTHVALKSDGTSATAGKCENANSLVRHKLLFSPATNFISWHPVTYSEEYGRHPLSIPLQSV